MFAEEEGPPPDWYANAFEAMQETPFLFLSAGRLLVRARTVATRTRRCS